MTLKGCMSEFESLASHKCFNVVNEPDIIEMYYCLCNKPELATDKNITINNLERH